MKLDVCYGLFRSPRPGGHPCRNAAHALREAELVRSYGFFALPDMPFDQTAGRKRAKEHPAA